MRMLWIVAALPFCALLVAGVPRPAAGAECVIYRHAIEFNLDAHVHMIVERGRDCRILFPLDDRTRIDSNEITVHPHYGGARVHGTSGAYYGSNPGYGGPDRFPFSFCGTHAGTSGCAKIFVKVDVR